ALNADSTLTHVPVIFITSHGDATFEVAGLAMGAADFIAKPVSGPIVLARVSAQLRIKRAADETRRIATIDSLTGVANRRQFDESLDREWRRARRSHDPLGLLLIDVDHFKLFNDRYGHQAGDVCLRSVAQALVRASLRPADLVSRYGGEEFAILLPQTPRGGAEHLAHRVLDAVEALAIAHEGSLTARHVTVSIGVACYDEESPCWVATPADSRFMGDQVVECGTGDLVQAADKALYAAKHCGRALAKLLDIADVNTPQLARDIAPMTRQRGGEVWA
ncbi:MAG: diguanylate cyclase, partial [Pseudomonadota bacterium]|nr:diguanylate cyclase [Pseudomonadota bacterium]